MRPQREAHREVTGREVASTVIRNTLAVGLLIAFASSEQWPLAAASVVTAAALLALPSARRSDRVASEVPLLPHSILTSHWGVSLANFGFGLGLIGGGVLLLHRDKPSTLLIDVLAFIAFAIPGVAILAILGSVLGRIMRDQATEFEAFIVGRAAATAFGVLMATAVVYAVADAVFGMPSLGAWWVLGYGVAQFSLALRVLRDRLS